MRWQTIASLMACAVGLLVLAEFVWEWWPEAGVRARREGPEVLARRAAVSATAVVPYLGLAGSAWVVRRDARRATVVAGTSVAALAVGLGGWVWAAGSDRESERAATLILGAGMQLLMWLAGAIVTGGRGSRAAANNVADVREPQS